MWFFILGGSALACAAFLLYLVTRFSKFRVLQKAAGEQKWKVRLLAFAMVFLLFGILLITLDVYNAVVSILHLGVIWLLCDGVSALVHKKKPIAAKKYAAGICALMITFVYLTTGWILAHQVWVTNYVVETQKTVGSLKVVFFADSHIGTTFDGEGFARQMQKVQNQNPDIVLIIGDYVDDDTTLEDMERACAALGELKTTYGVYYVYGNHDRGYYNRRGYDGAQLALELEKNNVTVLEDEIVAIDDRFLLIGRQDRSIPTREPMQVLAENLDMSKFSIVMDHQPNDFDAEAASGVDLVLSGHTHAGQLFPINYMGEWTGLNDLTYGRERRENTDFIVTSSIADWAIKFKTGCKSEIVVINIQGK